jgi:hypothetical protein
VAEVPGEAYRLASSGVDRIGAGWAHLLPLAVGGNENLKNFARLSSYFRNSETENAKVNLTITFRDMIFVQTNSIYELKRF